VLSIGLAEEPKAVSAYAGSEPWEEFSSQKNKNHLVKHSNQIGN
jgi:hypothetical protein